MEVGDKNTWFTECLHNKSIGRNGRYITTLESINITYLKQIGKDIYKDNMSAY